MAKQRQPLKELAVYKHKLVVHKGCDKVYDSHDIIALLIRCVFFRNEGAI